MTKEIVVRADGNPQIGIGHITRCLYFLENIKRDFNIFFLIAKNKQVKEYIESRGISVYEIDTNISLEEEIKFLTDLSTDLLIIDLRNKHESLYKNCSEKFNKVLRFDDSDVPIHINSDLYLNYNLYSEKLKFTLNNPDSELFLGPLYYILNPIFKNYKNFPRKYEEKGRNILITMGGGDPKNLTIKIVKSIIDIKDIVLNIIIGALFHDYEEIEKIKTDFPDKINIYKNIKNMPEMMAQNDILICTGGNTSFEAAFMGLPGLLLNQIDLQAKNSSYYEQKGIFYDGGLGENASEDFIKKTVEKLLSHKEIRKKFSSCGIKLNVSQGINKVIKKFIN